MFAATGDEVDRGREVVDDPHAGQGRIGPDGRFMACAAAGAHKHTADLCRDRGPHVLRAVAHQQGTVRWQPEPP